MITLPWKKVQDFCFKAFGDKRADHTVDIEVNNF